jgi:hypothetical protein
MKSTDGVGWEIDLIARTDARSDDYVNDVNEFHTGIALNPPPGFHFELYGTSELWKSGYTLVGPVVVTPGEEIRVALFRYTDKYPSLELGNFKGVNIILRETVSTSVTPEAAAPVNARPGFGGGLSLSTQQPPMSNPYQQQARQPEFSKGYRAPNPRRGGNGMM